MKYASSLNSQELESIKEEEELPIRQKKVSKSPLVLKEDDESGDSIYSDAFEILPREEKENVKITENIPKVKKRVSIEDVKGVVEIPRNEVSEEEMYERAYEAAMRKVYGDRVDRAGEASEVNSIQSQRPYQQKPYQHRQLQSYQSRSHSRANSLSNRSLRNIPIQTGDSTDGFKRYSLRGGDKSGESNLNKKIDNIDGKTKTKKKKKFWSRLFKR